MSSIAVSLRILMCLLSLVQSLRHPPVRRCRVCSRTAESISPEQLDDDKLRTLIADMDDDNKNMPWSRDDDLRLYRLYEGGSSIEEIANELKRGLRGVERRLSKISDISSRNYVFRNEEWDDDSDSNAGDAFSDVTTVYERILWDSSLDKSDFFFEYEDRFAGPQVASFVSPNAAVKGRERLLVKAIPPHRISKILFKSKVVWDKKCRVDLVFAGNNPGMTKLQDVIATYDDWLMDEATRNTPRANVTLYCDLDGVLCDFDQGVQRLFRGKRPAEVSPKLLWSVLCSADKNFYGTLPWTAEGELLWRSIKKLNPVLLSGVPGRTNNSSNWAALQKREWVDRHLGPEFRLITCSSKQKHSYCLNKGDILIDDNEKAREAWESVGGIFVLFDGRRDGNVASVLEAIAAADCGFDFANIDDGGEVDDT